MKHRKSVRRGQTLKTTRSEQMRPAQQTTISMVELLEIHSSVGAYHRRSEWPSDCVTCCRYFPAGRIPAEPISPRIWKTREQNAEKEMRPRARKNNHRAIRRPVAASRESNSHLIADR